MGCGRRGMSTETTEPSKPTPAQSQPGLILGGGRLTVWEIATQAAEQSGATGISTNGYRTSEEVS